MAVQAPLQNWPSKINDVKCICSSAVDVRTSVKKTAERGRSTFFEGTIISASSRVAGDPE